eukprot:CAMPEP_0117515148 /NCGR_PEP_ID=MMETSP0784-20121206/30431_1 /TAXON_ID=39447 /ORGANISM="" /LENGTH=525 /DNA_ID=CAMNT_0005310957 /DNA_START=61 /DNA_END=1636 /DNA_ORIENTATION=-
MQTMLSSAVRGVRKAKGCVLRRCKGDWTAYPLMAAAVFVAVMPFDLTQLVLMGTGALFYAFVRSTETFALRKKGALDPCKAKFFSPQSISQKQHKPRVHAFGQRPTRAARVPARDATLSVPGKEVKSVTSMPIERPVFSGSSFESDVSELVADIMPKPDSDRVVRLLAEHVRRQIASFFPGAEVIGFATGDFRRGKAFGVAVPEVDIVIKINSDSIATRLQEGRVEGVHRRLRCFNPDLAKLHKSMIRAITEQLVARGGFKFRRSAFRGTEPKVTMLAPKFEDSCEDCVSVDISVNAVLPLHNMALITSCGTVEPRAKELILLVRRWAKDRAICHAAKGHLSPYLWSLLTIYFLQVGVDSEGPLLPQLKRFLKSSSLMGQTDPRAAETAPSWIPPVVTLGGTKSVAALFEEFFHFYHARFDWSNEAISIRLGERAAPGPNLLRHVVDRAGSEGTVVAPSIEDPFDSTRNLAVGMNAASLARLREELARAQSLCAKGTTLTALLELWSPPGEKSNEAADAFSDDTW